MRTTKSNILTQGYRSLKRHLVNNYEIFFNSEAVQVIAERKEQLHREFLSSFCVFMLLTNFIIILMNPYEVVPWNWVSMILHILNGIFTVFLRIFSQKQRRFQSQLLILLFTAIQHIWFIESFLRSADSFRDRSSFYLAGGYEHSLFLTLSIAQINLKKNLFLVLLLNAYGLTRMTLILDEEGLLNAFFYGKMYMMVSHFFLAVISQSQCLKDQPEKGTEIINQKNFSLILRNQLPFSIFIVQNKKTVFMNELAQKLFGADELTKRFFQSIENMTDTNLNKTELFDPSKFLSKTFRENTNDSIEPLLIIDDNHDHDKESENLNRVDFGGSFLSIDMGKFRSYLIKNWQKDGPAMFEAKVSIIDWEAKPAYIIIISESILAEKYITSRAELIQKDNIMASVTHDLRTPLNGILGIMDIVIETIEQKTLLELMNLAKTSASHLQFIINDLLDSSQIFNGKLRLRFDVFSLKECVQSVIELLKFSARQRGLELTLINQAAGTGLVKNDLGRIRQILMNLVGNALKFTEKGGVKIIIEDKKDITSMNFLEVSSVKQESTYLLRVKDSGCGISNEDLGLLFQEYSTIKNDKTKKLNKGGVGLGLVISEKLAKAINNVPPNNESIIKVRSQVGHGTEFSFPIISWDVDSQVSVNMNEIIEFQNSAKDIANKLNEVKPQNYCFFPKTSTQGTTPLKRILIVDDDEINLIVSSHYLSGWNSSILEKASNGKMALDIISARARERVFFDVIIMDYNMPIMDGLAAAKEIKKMVSERVIPGLFLIAVSGDAENSEEFLEAGAIEHIVKPFCKNDLLNILNNLLNKS